MSVKSLGGWTGALVSLAWSRTCRYRYMDDPRPDLARSGGNWIYATLHAHQLAALFAERYAGLMAMVSRSGDGDLLAPSLRVRGFTPVRGSSRTATEDKGGRSALRSLVVGVEARHNALLAVDGPRGPRGCVHRGVARLAAETGTAVLPVVVIPTRRWVLRRSWDRFQIPKPFARIDAFFGELIEPRDLEIQALVARVRGELLRLERRYDPEEAAAGEEASRIGPAPTP